MSARFARVNAGSSHSYTLDGEPIPGVTTVIGQLDKPALVGWAANETAAYADEHWARLSELRSADRIKELAGARFNTNRKAIVRGNRIHALGERLGKGETKITEVPMEIQPAVQAYADFLDRWGFEVEQTETPVAHTEFGYGGTLDVIVRSAKFGRTLLDIKGLALDTLIPTPTGWTTMGDVQVGDQVFDAHGAACTVRIKSATKRIGTYVVKFDDGSQIVCDREHIWWTQERSEDQPSAKPVEQMRLTLRKWGQRNHRVPVAGPLALPDRDLPIDPYLLGVWLGDGSARDGEVTKTPELFTILEDDGHRLGVVQRCHSPAVITRTVRGLRTALREQKLQYAKRIPSEYLRAGVQQRTLLLQGLMDTDGTWNTARDRACFTSTDEALARQVFELLATLGQRPHLATTHTTGFGKAVTAYAVEFTPVDLLPFRLPAKAAKVQAKKVPYCATRRVVVSVEPGPDVETACIGVDSADHTYLCGEAMIPTHNTGKNVYSEVALQLAAYRFADVMLREVEQRGPRGGKLPSLWVEEPVQPVDTVMVAHVLGDSVELVPVVADESVLDAFLHLLEVWYVWHQRVDRSQRGKASFDPPVGAPIWPEDELEERYR